MSSLQHTIFALLLFVVLVVVNGCARAASRPEPITLPHGTVSEYVVSGRQVNLVWQDRSSNELGFKVERKQDAAGTYREIATVGENVTTYMDTEVREGASYHYRVRAYNLHGYSSYSEEICVTVAGR